MRKIFSGIVFLILLAPLARAHGDEEKIGQLSFLDPVTSMVYSLAVIFVLVFLSIVFRDKLTGKRKKILFGLILIPILFSTAYVAASTVYLNLVSETGGPAHWHAEFEVWICGQKILLKGPSLLDNKVGTATIHHHNEGIDLDGRYRIHVEGVLAKKEEANLSHFFEAIGDYLQKDSIGLFLKDGSQKRWNNGDVCPNTGKTGSLKVFVNGREIDNAPEYVISPYTNVPPGDFIKIVFE